MDKFTRTLIFNSILLVSIVAFVIAGRDGWAVFFTILLFVDKL